MPWVPAPWSSAPPIFGSNPISSQSSEAITQPLDFLAFRLWVQGCQDLTVAVRSGHLLLQFRGVIIMSLDGAVLTWEPKTSEPAGPQAPGWQRDSWTHAFWL